MHSGKFMSYIDEAKRTELTGPYQNTQKVFLYMGLGNHFPEKYAWNKGYILLENMK